jgi:hypothetical protein
MLSPRFVALTCATLLFVVHAGASGQSRRVPSFNHSISGERQYLDSHPFPAQSLPHTVRVLAVMVEFQPDDDPLTTENGLFNLSTTTEEIIDPPPHDSTYFRNHLSFLENYWRRVSNGTIIVRSDIVPVVIRLSNPMRSYSPPPQSATNSELAAMVRDVWRSVDSLPLSIPFSDYDAFLIFHAGVGRDIDLESIYGYDPTPYDIPSLYFDLAALRRAFGAGHSGIPVQDSSFFITNSIVVPRTESRYIPTLGGQFLLQLGINGLLAASLGSYLGLPDLFDTETGQSGIGRFGLMDGQSIFSWNGVFPPEPSAWEKYFLEMKYKFGMVDVIDVPTDTSMHSLKAVSATTAGKDTLLRIRINAREYFLLENRNRDANRDGTTVWRVVNNTIVQETFSRDTTGFSAFDQRRLHGVVVDVDEFDFSLPGGVTEEGEFFDGGILVWHIDESVIDARYATNRVNANPSRRGVDLEEADGSQDIGQSYGFLDPASGSEAGTSLDFWFLGNASPVYRNEFSPTTHPNSLSNSGANSRVTLKDFTTRGPRMEFRVHLGDDLARPLPGYPTLVGRSSTDGSPQWSMFLFVNAGDSVYAFRSDTALSATKNPQGLFSPLGGRFPISFLPMVGDTLVLVGVHDSTVIIWRTRDGDADGVLDSTESRSINVGATITTDAVVKDVSRGAIQSTAVYVGDALGIIHRVTVLGSSVDTSFAVASSPVTSIAGLTSSSPFFAVAGNTLWKEEGASATLPRNSTGWQLVITGDNVAVGDVGGTTVILFDPNLHPVRTFNSLGYGFVSPLASGDINGDGSHDVIFGAGTKLFVLNRSGAMVDNFPVTLPAQISGAPAIARLSSVASEAQILVATSNGMLSAYDNKGKPHPGFPLPISGGGNGTPSVFTVPSPSLSSVTPRVFVTDESGYLNGWRLQDIVVGPGIGIEMPWGSYRGNTYHTGSSLSPLAGSPVSSVFFPKDRAYNWPNPVYDGKTYIRYFVKENATVAIKIFDLAGEKVDEFGGPGIGGVDNEVEWNVGSVQSGIYFGRIEARAGGRQETAIIKIAVVK